MKNICVVIPIYKKEPTKDEVFSIKNVIEKLNSLDIYFIAPRNLCMKNYIFGTGIKIKSFSKKYFKDIYGYNNLMLKIGFYRKFRQYEYILIVQPDVLILRNAEYLLNLINKYKYDYYGAPWKHTFYKNAFDFTFYKKGLKKFTPLFNFFNLKAELCMVGNGGLSLRNTRATIRLLRHYFFYKLLWGAQEDCFYSYFGTKYKHFSIATKDVASLFSWEETATTFLHYQELPFGVHAWTKFFPDIMSYFNIINKDYCYFKNIFEYKLGTKIYFTRENYNASPYILSGICNIEEDGTWIEDKNAIFAFKINNSQTKISFVHIKFTLKQIYNIYQVIDIYANENYITRQIIFSDENTLEFDIPFTPIIYLHLMFLTSKQVNSSEQEFDTRTISIYITSLTITESNIQLNYNNAIQDFTFYLYGAGIVAKRCLLAIKNNYFSPKALIVSTKTQDNAELLGIPIISIDEVNDKNAKIFIATGKKNHEDIIRTLKEKQFTNFSVLF